MTRNRIIQENVNSMIKEKVNSKPFDFLFMDEPISHLDEVNAKNMASIITEEAMRQGAGVVVTSIGKHLELDYTKKMML